MSKSDEEKVTAFIERNQQSEADKVKAFEEKNRNRALEAQAQMAMAQRRGEMLHLTHAAVVGLSCINLTPEEIAEKAVAIGRATMKKFNEATSEAL